MKPEPEDAGNVPIQITNNPGFDGYPTWSPDGTKIAFWSSDPTGPHPPSGGYDSAEIWVMDAVDSDGDGNGDHLTRLTNNPAVDIHPDWGPAPQKK